MRSRVLLTTAGAASLLVGSSAAVLGLAQGAALAATPCGTGGTGGVSSCTYTSTAPDTFTVPAGVTQVTFTLDGGQGGSFPRTPAGGRGGRVTAVLQVSPGQVFHVNVGGEGSANTSPGGINNGSGGGGGSDVRTSSSAASRVLVAGGGGGTGGSRTDSLEMGGAGGTGGGGNGSNGSSGVARGGAGGTITAGGAGGTGPGGNGAAGVSLSGGTGGTFGSGVGGFGGANGGGQGGVGRPVSGCPGGGGGGGGGYFGGGGGGATIGGTSPCAGGNGGGGGGGGSSYVVPTALSSTSDAGVHSGSGEVLVNWKAPTMLTVTPQVSGVSLTAVATLTGPVGPLSRQTITFTAGPTVLCVASTDSSGQATCALPISTWQAVYIFGVTATYAGNTTYQGSTVTSPFPI